MDVASINTLSADLLATANTVRSGRSSVTVYGRSGARLRQTLVALAAGQALSEHKSPGDASVYCLQGQVVLRAGELRTEIGPDATSVGWVYQYALGDKTGQNDLAQLRTLQDWNVRFQLQSVPGVAEVASVGGFQKQYQVNINPNALSAYNIPLPTVVQAIRDGNNDVGGRVVAGCGRTGRCLPHRMGKPGTLFRRSAYCQRRQDPSAQGIRHRQL